MKRELKKHLFEFSNSIDSIFEYLGEERDFLKYQENKMLRRAVEREIEIIGEAVSRILKENSQFEIENARKIVDARNWVIHGYDKVDNAVIWGIISNHLPKLKLEIDRMSRDKE